LFISHAWDYTEEYDRLVNLLNADGNFRWENLSVPARNPLLESRLLPKSLRYLLRQLEQKIAKADCVVVIPGMYCAHSEWIQSEIEAAKEYGKPIIAVRLGGQERFPEAVKLAADEIVSWYTTSIVLAIRKVTAPSAPAPLPQIPFSLGAPSGPHSMAIDSIFESAARPTSKPPQMIGPSSAATLLVGLVSKQSAQQNLSSAATALRAKLANRNKDF